MGDCTCDWGASPSAGGGFCDIHNPRRYTPQGYPANNPTFDRNVKRELQRDAKKIREGEKYLKNAVKQLRASLQKAHQEIKKLKKSRK